MVESVASDIKEVTTYFKNLLIEKRTSSKELDKLVSFGKDNNHILDKIAASLLALTPLLQHYKGPIYKASFSVLIIIFPILVFKVIKYFKKLKFKNLIIVSPLIIYFLYIAINNGFKLYDIGYSGLMIVYLAAIALGLINVRQVFKTAYFVTIAASIGILIQTLTFYIFNYHIQMVPISLFLPESKNWIGAAHTGLVTVSGTISAIYRPSAFFLEPSHMYLYFFPILIFMLFSPDLNGWKFRRAIYLSLALILSTSGMGMGIVGLSWLAFALFSDYTSNKLRLKNISRKKNIFIFLIIVLLALLIYFCFPFVNRSINRILRPTGGERLSAIEGRTASGKTMVKRLKGKEIIFGSEDPSNALRFKLSAFAATMIRYGLFGVVLSYIFYLMSLIKLKAHYRWISLIILITSFFSAHTHGTFYMLYYVLILMSGFYILSKLDQKQEACEGTNNKYMENIEKNEQM